MQEKYLNLLKRFVGFKSISTDPKYKEEIERTCQWLEDLFKGHGFETKIIRGYDNPVVYASYQISPEARTYLIYGHYDVQPAQKENGWSFDPFELKEKDGKLYARGVVDNKGQVLIHIFSVLQLIEQNRLGFNVKFLIEGNEETGSDQMTKLLKDNKRLFDADYIMISDGEMPYRPAITASFRGAFNLTLRLKTANNSLHSGLYGGAVPNAAQELAKLISRLYDSDYNCLIPGFYTKDDPINKQELKNCLEMDQSKKGMLGKLGIKRFFLDQDQSFCKKVGFKSMLTVTGFKSGYIQQGYSNIVPNVAEAKINFRLASSQKPEEVLEMFIQFVKQQAPEYVELEIQKPQQSIKPIKVDLSSEEYQRAINLLEQVYQDKVLVDYCGATLPIVVDFKQVFGIEPLLVSLANDDCNMHGVDENFDIGLIEKGLKFSQRFFGKPTF